MAYSEMFLTVESLSGLDLTPFSLVGGPFRLAVEAKSFQTMWSLQNA